ncbi:FAD-dependent oxidoreductase, partial [Candidatus Woesebacteria bacterium]|nr:FAD-dependent oxidoreductase [Candidatus Woesebacteria bacterium]
EYVTAVDFSVRPFKLWTGFPAGFDLQQFEQLTPELSRQLVEQVKINQPTYLADSVIISTGAVSKMIGVPGEQEFLGRGVSTCAVCDAAFYKDKVTYVVGGGDSAMEDTLALTKFAQSVTVIHRRDQFKASKIMQERVLNHPKVKVMWNSAPLEIKGADQVTSLVVKTQTDQGEQIQELPTDGV